MICLNSMLGMNFVIQQFSVLIQISINLHFCVCKEKAWNKIDTNQKPTPF